jgi:uncharacterized membrane protein HdeD (DUF308 family)
VGLRSVSQKHAGDDVDAVRRRGLRFLTIGTALLLFGITAVLLPDASNVAIGTVLGAVVTAGGIVVVVQALRDVKWRGFSWQLMFGSAEIVGGVVILSNPLKGAAAITLLVVIVMFAQSFTQAGLALRVRPAQGWWWLLVASAVTAVFAGGLALRFPYQLVGSAGEMAGIAMALAGFAFLMIGGGWLGLKMRTSS